MGGEEGAGAAGEGCRIEWKGEREVMCSGALKSVPPPPWGEGWGGGGAGG